MLSSAVVLLLLGAGPVPELSHFDDPFTPTVSGGVSLGTYEGLTWTLVRLRRGTLSAEERGHQRVPTLLAVTGASAGGVNALLAGALWCEASDETANLSVDQNLLRKAFVALTIADLNGALYWLIPAAWRSGR
jgi:hypothetical protein